MLKAGLRLKDKKGIIRDAAKHFNMTLTQTITAPVTVEHNTDICQRLVWIGSHQHRSCVFLWFCHISFKEVTWYFIQ